MNSTFTNSNGTTYTFTCGTENGPLAHSLYWPNRSGYTSGRIWATAEEEFTNVGGKGSTVAELVADIDWDDDTITIAIVSDDDGEDDHAMLFDVWYLARVD